MAIKTFKEVVSVERSRQARVSDFSGQEIPQFHWSAVTNIWCTISDHGGKGGNQRLQFDLDLMPEELADFQRELARLVESMKAKYSRRVSGHE